MKSPAEYLDAAWQLDPEEWPVGGRPYVPQEQAERAIAAALADAERYRNNLVGAVLRSHSSTTQAEQATPPHEL